MTAITRDWTSPLKFGLLIGETQDLPGQQGWLPPILFVVLASMLVQYAMTPLAASLLGTLPSATQLTPEQRAHALEVFLKTRYLSIGLTPFSVPLRLLLAAWVTYMITVLLDIRVTFRKLFTGFAFSACVSTLCSAIIAATVLYTRPESIAGMQPSIGLTLFYEPENPLFRALLASLTIVLAWQFAVLVSFLKKETGVSLAKVLIIAAPVGLFVPIGIDVISNLIAS